MFVIVSDNKALDAYTSVQREFPTPSVAITAE
jgi:hypothetical protein